MQFNKKKLSEICAATLIAGGAAATIAPSIALAATAAGTLIKNLATVTYEDANGNEYSAQSNEAVITVMQVYSAELSEDKTTTAAAGQTTYIQHTLTNTGNGTDTYTLDTAGAATMYLDSNGNGLADAGEQVISEGGSVTLAAGESAEIVLAVAVPNTAESGDTISVKLTAAANSGTVADTGDNADSATDVLDNSATNDDTITVSTNAVLNYTKAAIWSDAPDPANMDPNNPLTWPKITYTLTITNTGNQDAKAVNIRDGVPAGMTQINTPIASGILAANGDDEPVFTTLDEATDGIDYDNNGNIAGTVPGIEATDASIAPGQTVSITFEAAYDPYVFNNNGTPGSAGDIVDNRGHLTADLDGNPATPEPPIESNPTQTELPQVFNIDTSDTGVTGAVGANDGGDDDATDQPDESDMQTVSDAASGSTVLFPVVLTNSGTGSDTLDLVVDNTSFPPGTTFTFWEENGNVPLVDTNGEMGPDSGVLDAGESKTIMVKANLPSNADTTNNVNNTTPGTGYQATVTATSANAPTTSVADGTEDSTTLQLNNINAATVDLRDTSTPATTDDDDALGATPYNINDQGANTDGNPAYAGVVGGTVVIPFHIDNNSGSSDAFQLSAGSSYDGTNVGALPTGWDVTFYKGNGSGQPMGQPLTSTELLPANSIGAGAVNEYVAVVSIPSDNAMALADYMADNDGDTGSIESMDASADGDGDQPIFIKIESANSSASDVMLDAIDVAPIRDITLTPPGANQIQPGGSVDYLHTLDNTGNTDETLELSASNSLNPDGWNNSISVPVDDDDDTSTPPINKPLSQLEEGDLIQGTGPDGQPVTMPVLTGSLSPTDLNPDITVPAGVEVPLIPTVFAPSDAAPGTIDTLTIMAESPDSNGPTAIVEDVSEVIVGQVRLTKTVAYDANCDGVEADTAFMTNLTTEIPPGECALWQIIAENQGDAKAMNVIIHDEVTAFTAYAEDTLSYALANGSAAPIEDNGSSANAAEVTLTDDAITFYVGAGANSVTGMGGELLPGQFATVRFSTRIE